MTGSTLTIDDGEPGTWATALAHSPNLVAVEYVDEARRASLRRMVALDGAREACVAFGLYRR